MEDFVDVSAVGGTSFIQIILSEFIHHSKIIHVSQRALSYFDSSSILYSFSTECGDMDIMQHQWRISVLPCSNQGGDVFTAAVVIDLSVLTAGCVRPSRVSAGPGEPAAVSAPSAAAGALLHRPAPGRRQSGPAGGAEERLRGLPAVRPRHRGHRQH